MTKGKVKLKEVFTNNVSSLPCVLAHLPAHMLIHVHYFNNEEVKVIAAVVICR